ncbi:MAG: radical SAM protein [Spirochaetales bacterium]|nr:radical SAM protein [Spirochaetales bacterium]
MLSIEVTTMCNLDCINCFARSGAINNEHIELHVAKNIAYEGIELGYREISLTGGETLLWPYLLEFIVYLSNIGYNYILINSNMHKMDAELGEKLLEFKNILTFSCSINGFKCDHDFIRGKGSFEAAVNGLKIGLNLGFKVHIYTVISKGNLYNIPRFSEWMFTEFKLIEGLVFIQLRSLDDNKLSPKEFIEFVKMVSYLSLAGYNVSILENSLSTVVANSLGVNWLPKSPEISRKGKIVVLQNLNVTDNHSSETILGKYQNNLDEFLNQPQYLQITQNESILCKSCKFVSKCRECGKLRPSDRLHNVGDESIYYCQKVLELLNG